MAGKLATMRRSYALALAAALVLFAASCVPPSTMPDGSVSQTPPLGAQGLAFDGTNLWLADLFGGQLLKIDPDDGRILARIGPDLGIAPPDDLVVAPDGSIVYTSPGTGIVGRVRLSGPPAGRVTVLAKVEQGVNPIALTPDGTAVVVGWEQGANRIDRIDLATGARTAVAAGIGGLNGFSFGPDGALWAPTGGPVAIFTGEGGIARIDIGTGAVTGLPLTFPGEPGKRGLSFGVSAKWTPEGDFLGLQGVDAALYLVDPVTGETGRFAATGSQFGDNMVALPDGRVFVSNFLGGLDVVDFGGHAAPFHIGA
jgi:streptogramin lyase